VYATVCIADPDDENTDGHLSAVTCEVLCALTSLVMVMVLLEALREPGALPLLLLLLVPVLLL
jgi:hypothetical protein